VHEQLAEARFVDAIELDRSYRAAVGGERLGGGAAVRRGEIADGLAGEAGLAGDCAPYMRSDSCACAGTSEATPLMARCATAMRVSPFGSLAFMLPEASRMSAMVRPAVLQDWAAAGSGPATSATATSAISARTGIFMINPGVASTRGSSRIIRI
jgi:hypothetical protein